MNSDLLGENSKLLVHPVFQYFTEKINKFMKFTKNPKLQFY